MRLHLLTASVLVFGLSMHAQGAKKMSGFDFKLKNGTEVKVSPMGMVQVGSHPAVSIVHEDDKFQVASF